MAACAPENSPAAATPPAIAFPVFDITGAGGAGNTEGWNAVGSTSDRPALTFYENARPALILACNGTQMKVQVRGFTPKQAWPQPELTIRTGAALRAETPDVRNIGDQVAYEVGFAIADEVLALMSGGGPVAIEFNNQNRTFANIPAVQAKEFTDRCASLVPSGMRSANR